MTIHNSSYDATLVAPHPRGEGGQRTLVILLAVITGLLFTLGIAGWWLLAGINARYTQMLAETTTSLSQLHEIGLHTFTGYGNIMQLCHTRDVAVRANLHETVLGERAKNDKVFEKLQQSLTDPALVESLREVIAKRAACRTRADAFITMAFTSGASAVDSGESLMLLQDYVAYQEACNKLTEQIEAASHQLATGMAAEVTKMRWLFLVVGALPIIAGLGFLLLTISLLKVIKLDGEEED
jgi:hypothetical protein